MRLTSGRSKDSRYRQGGWNETCSSGWSGLLATGLKVSLFITLPAVFGPDGGLGRSEGADDETENTESLVGGSRSCWNCYRGHYRHFGRERAQRFPSTRRVLSRQSAHRRQALLPTGLC